MSEIRNKAIVEKRKKSNITWIIPLVALLSTVWLIYKSVSEAGVDIVVNFKSGNGFKAGKTNVVYKGYNVGKITKITVGSDLNSVNAHIRINKDASNLIARDGTDFWIVQPRFSVSEISGLDTIISGVYIEVRPNSIDKEKLSSKNKKLYFKGHEEKPLKYYKEDGKNITLNAKNLSGINIGTPVFYKKFKIGEVIATKLFNDNVKVYINIKNEYSNLVNTSTLFWNISGIDVDANLSGINVKMDSLTSFVSGGIAFETLDLNAMDIENGKDELVLYDSFNEAQFRKVPVELIFKSASGIIENKTEIQFRGIPIGIINSISYENNQIVAKAHIDKKFEHFNKSGTKYHIVDLNVNNLQINNADTVLKGKYLNVIPGNGKSQGKFYVYDSKDDATNLNFKNISIKSEKLYNINVGSKIYYKNIEVGHVNSYKFTKDFNNVIIYAGIKNRFSHLLNEKTLFYSISTPLVEANNFDVKVNYEGIKPLFFGGIGIVYTPSKITGENNKFWLYDSYNEMSKVKQKYTKGNRIRVKIDELMKLKHDMPIYYKNQKIGYLEGFDYSNNEAFAILFIKDDFTSILTKHSKFFINSAVDMKANITDGVSLKFGSFENFLKGAIMLTNKSERIDKENRLYKSFEELPFEKYEIDLTFKNIDGMSAKNVNIIYKGIVVGKVTKVQLNENLKELNAKAYIFDKYKNLASKDSIFYIVKPNISFNEASGLDTIVKGSYINIINYNKGKNDLAKNFEVFSSKPKISQYEKGLNIVLQANNSGSLTTNSFVYYKKIKVGEVERIDLDNNSKLVNVKIFIYDKYKRLVRDNTKFYNISGFDMDLSLTGANIKADSLSSVVFGGVSFSTPNEVGSQSKNGDTFTLHSQVKDEWKNYNPEIILN